MIVESFTDNVRVSVIQNTKTAQTAKNRHKLLNKDATLLGKAMAGVSLLASLLEGDERIKATFSSSGPIKTICVEAIHVGEVRGFVERTTETELECLGTPGILKVSKILYGHSLPLDSIVELKHGDIVSDFQNYFELSDQISSIVDLKTIVDATGTVLFSGGYLMQELPSTSAKSTIKSLQQFLKEKDALNMFIKDLLSSDKHLSPYSMLKYILPDEEYKTLPAIETMQRYPIDFHCRCSKGGFTQALTALGKQELLDVVESNLKQGKSTTDLTCHFCNKVYSLQNSEIEQLAANVN